jgi:hypothetical protein
MEVEGRRSKGIRSKRAVLVMPGDDAPTEERDVAQNHRELHSNTTILHIDHELL